MEYDATGLMREIKLRLQAQQGRITGRPDNEVAHLQIRAELDALWACVEVLAQAIDGNGTIRLPDYWSQHH